MTTVATPQAAIEPEADIDCDRLELASAIYELYVLGFIAEEIDKVGTPRFRPTGRLP